MPELQLAVNGLLVKCRYEGFFNCLIPKVNGQASFWLFRIDIREFVGWTNTLRKTFNRRLRGISFFTSFSWQNPLSWKIESVIGTIIPPH